MPVTWNGNIPASTDFISTSQGQIQTNNQSIATVFNEGANNFFKMAMQGVGTLASVTDPVSAIHAINGAGITFNGKPIPYFKNSVGDFPIIPDIQGGSPTFHFYIGNLLVYFGTVSGTATATANFSPAYTSATSYCIVGIVNGNVIAIGVTQTSNSVATFNFAGLRTINYIAIGY